jgi:transcriptional regulator with PAS, ATPase and Fis domain
LIARSIHDFGQRQREPFLAINCGALTESLLESELFGHVKGAFTGAINPKKGLCDMADKGTIFFDEIGNISPETQAKLLRVLQDREFTPVGSEKPVRTEARFIAATHRPLEEMLVDGRFREDLYYRLNVVEIVVPPLRERREDIPLLVDQLTRKIARELHRDGVGVTPAALRALLTHDWPGNVRELENELRRAAVLAPRGVIDADDLALRKRARHAPRTNANDDDITLASVERRHLERVLEMTGGNKRQAARLLRVTRPRLDRLLSRYDIVATKYGQSGTPSPPKTSPEKQD